MPKIAYKINADGFLLFGEEIFINEDEQTPNQYIDTPLPVNENNQQLPFFKPRWNGTQWVEGEPEEERIEREEAQHLESMMPSPQELENADFEIKMLSLLIEMEVI